MPQPNTTVLVLLFGDYCALATKCLDSVLAATAGRAEIRVGMNAVGDATREFVDSLVRMGMLARENVYDSPENLHKYPMMRKLLYYRPITTEFVMWFDDDSWIADPRPDWLNDAEAAMRGVDMIGSPYTVALAGGQADWIKSQAWYTGQPFRRNAKQQDVIAFCTGGWWTIRTAVLRRYDWPIIALNHRGGDVMLGALCQQQQLLQQWQ